MNLEPHEKALLLEFLDELSQRFSNDGCNDWEWPKDWTHDQRSAFAREFIAYNENRDVSTVTKRDVAEVFNYMGNHMALGALIGKLRKET